MTQLPSVSELMINTAKSENSPPATSAEPPSKAKSTSPRSPSTIPRIASESSFSSKYNYGSSRSGSTVLPVPPLRRLTEPSIMYNQGHSAPLQPHQLPQPPQPQPHSHSVPAHIVPPKGGALSAPGQLHQGSDYFNNSHHPSQIPGNYQLNQRVSISSSIDPLSREPSSSQIPLSSPGLNKQSHPANAVASHANLPPIPQYPQHPSQSQGTSPTSGNPPYSYPDNIQFTSSQPSHHEMNPPPPGISYYYPVAPLYQQGGQGPQGPQGPPGSQGPPGHQNPHQNPHQGLQEMYGPQGHPQPFMYQMGHPGGQIPPQQAIPNPGGSQPIPGYYHPGIPHHYPGMENGMPMMGVGMPMASGIYEENNALINKRRIIKRRTRTGCLTCRKRRIKCDERKPTCFNCERSKKVCLGYEKLNGLGNKKRKDSNLDLHPEYDDENEQDHDPEQDQVHEQDDDEGLSQQNEQTKEQQNGTGDHSGSASHYPINTNETNSGESKISVHNLIK